MKKLTLLFILFSSIFSAQKTKTPQISGGLPYPKEYTEIEQFQKELNEEYSNAKTSPLRGENVKKFTEHPFFDMDLKWRVTAKLVKTKNAKPFEIPTSSGRTKEYREFGKVYFKLDGKEQVLTVHQSLSLMKNPEYKDYLFLPFRDLTNGLETYGGGRYIDLRIPKTSEIIIDFNKAYQPYCAYNATDYNCPVVPKENWLNIRIESGVKYENIWFEH